MKFKDLKIGDWFKRHCCTNYIFIKINIIRHSTYYNVCIIYAPQNSMGAAGCLLYYEDDEEVDFCSSIILEKGKTDKNLLMSFNEMKIGTVIQNEDMISLKIDDYNMLCIYQPCNIERSFCLGKINKALLFDQYYAIKQELILNYPEVEEIALDFS